MGQVYSSLESTGCNDLGACEAEGKENQLPECFNTAPEWRHLKRILIVYIHNLSIFISSWKHTMNYNAHCD